MLKSTPLRVLPLKRVGCPVTAVYTDRQVVRLGMDRTERDEVRVAFGSHGMCERAKLARRHNNTNTAVKDVTRQRCNLLTEARPLFFIGDLRWPFHRPNKI